MNTTNQNNKMKTMRNPSRMFASILLLIGLVAGNLQAQLVREANTTLKLPTTLPSGALKLEQAFAPTFVNPVGIATSPNESNVLYVIEKAGKIYRVTNLNTTPAKSLFMDISNRVSQAGDEEGLLGLAFHPNYANNGTFFVFYVSRSPRTDILSRFTRSSASAGNAGSEQKMIVQPDEFDNHNGGDLHFGPDGYLYVSLGDEGKYNGLLDNAQKIDKDFFSGILRIDVDRKSGNREPNNHTAIQKPGGVATYKVPADNPFVDAGTFNGKAVVASKVRSEFWAVGLRNPWRFSFDSANGRMFAGDVGQDKEEEVDIIVKGGNYGWNYREGSIKGPTSAGTPPAGFHPIEPIYTYKKVSSVAVIGGVVYRGSKIPDLVGKYVFGDYATKKFWALKQSGSNWVKEDLNLNPVQVVAFGTDPTNGDVLVVDGVTGKIWRLTKGVATGSFPAKLSQTGTFQSLSTLTPNAGIVPFEPKVTFWSDQAKKKRWFSVPKLSDKIAFKKDSPWTFPNGTVWIKHFDLLLDRRNPNSARRLETRFLVKTADGTYGLTYKWNTAQTEADLVAEDGATENINIIDESGVSRVQKWYYPSRSDCLACHTAVAGPPLGFTTHQLNTTFKYGSQTINQLTALKNAGYFSNTVPAPSTLGTLANADDASQSLEFRVRSYLEVNCVQCHQPGGSAPTNWDARTSTPIADAGIINGALIDDGGVSTRRVVVPGNTSKSVLLSRIKGSDGFRRMPPLATFELDQKSIDLVTAWINEGSGGGGSSDAAVNAGGPAVGSFAADTGFSGGWTVSTTATISTTGVTGAAPAAVYQKERRGDFTYTVTGLTPGASYDVRLHFSENKYTAVNQHIMGIKINGTTVISNLDIFAEAGGKNKALVKTVTVQADSTGKLVIKTVKVTANAPSLCGFEVTANGAPPPASLVFQAESFTTKDSGTKLKSEYGGFTGTGYMDYGKSGSYLEWNNVSAPSNATYHLTFRYSNGSSTYPTRGCDVLVNGVKRGSVAFGKTASWNAWSELSVDVPLNKGTNKIRLKATTSSGGPNLDKMTVE